ncbi:hypothetical protein JZ751_001196, partial [Albula glossodonta]
MRCPRFLFSLKSLFYLCHSVFVNVLSLLISPLQGRQGAPGPKGMQGMTSVLCCRGYKVSQVKKAGWENQALRAARGLRGHRVWRVPQDFLVNREWKDPWAQLVSRGTRECLELQALLVLLGWMESRVYQVKEALRVHQERRGDRESQVPVENQAPQGQQENQVYMVLRGCRGDTGVPGETGDPGPKGGKVTPA